MSKYIRLIENKKCGSSQHIFIKNDFSELSKVIALDSLISKINYFLSVDKDRDVSYVDHDEVSEFEIPKNNDLTRVDFDFSTVRTLIEDSKYTISDYLRVEINDSIFELDNNFTPETADFAIEAITYLNVFTILKNEKKEKNKYLQFKMYSAIDDDVEDHYVTNIFIKINKKEAAQIKLKTLRFLVDKIEKINLDDMFGEKTLSAMSVFDFIKDKSGKILELDQEAVDLLIKESSQSKEISFIKKINESVFLMDNSTPLKEVIDSISALDVFE